ncbi:MAG: NAD(P)-dependent alcohol dehydrogenase [Alphaproteobacteria bacterium]|nr:NAD(P)-dependent alcohol dehydrogenase [Alphaproteobacteria bacterium]
MTEIRAWAAQAPRTPLAPWSFDPGPLAPEDVEVAVEHCGICHSDLSMLDNEWGISRYPLVAGHEAIGRVVALGERAKGLKLGQRVGVGWTAESCMHCRPCLSGDQHLCGGARGTIVGHAGGFAERLRAHWAWALPLPEKLDPAAAGPLLCGGVTVFAPLLVFGVKPTSRVGVVGIGGLGHMAVKFAAAWGCEVTAFTSSEGKAAEAKSFGAHNVVSSRDSAAIRRLAGSLDLLLVTVNVTLDWTALMATLAPNGRLHVVGAVLEPIPVRAFDLIGGQRSVSGSPTGSPTTIAAMLDFAARHQILPQIERFPMSAINEALARLGEGKARYRIVLDADFG